MRAILSSLLLASLIPGAAVAQRTMTKTDLRAQPPATTDRQLREQMWNIFRREDRRSKTPPRASLDTVWNATQPYATTTKGLCRYDIVVLHFAPVDATPRPDADTPMRAYGIEASAKFRFIRQPSTRGDADRSQDPWRTECTSIDTDKVDFFSAPDNDVALDGYRAWMAAADAIEKGGLKVVPCDRFLTDTASCEAIIAAAAKTMPDSIDRCEAAAKLQCFKIDDGDRGIRIFLVGEDGYRDAQGAAVPVGTVVSVSLEGYIVFADQRID